MSKIEKVPKNLQNDQLSEYLKSCGLERIHQGKVRDTYRLENGQLLIVASDRISIFDFVLNALVPFKGAVLTALTHFWLTDILIGADNHLIQSEKYPLYNSAFDLRLNSFSELPIERCLVVKDCSGQLYPFEMIFRHHIGGSIYKDYLKTGLAAGQAITPGLPQWSKLETPVFTPSTKAEDGHDENVSADFFYQEMAKKGLGTEAKQVVNNLIENYQKIYAFAELRGVIILDTKMEVAGLTIVDELGTPDSSRFTIKEDWLQAMQDGRAPQFWDKQPVRDWGATVPTPFVYQEGDKKGEKIIGIKNLDPENPEHVAFVHSLEVPSEVISQASERYQQIFKKITGNSLQEYQKSYMGFNDKY